VFAEILLSVISGFRAGNTFLQTSPELLKNTNKRSGRGGFEPQTLGTRLQIDKPVS
jgi:hypothetical protein